MYSDIINKERNTERATGFMEKIMSCILVEVHIRENSKGQRYYILQVFLFLMEEGRIRGTVEPNDKSTYYYKFLDLE